MQCSSRFLHSNGVLYCRLEENHKGLHYFEATVSHPKQNMYWGTEERLLQHNKAVAVEAEQVCPICKKPIINYCGGLHHCGYF